MATITRVFQEMLPAVKLIGRRYTDADRNTAGSFAHKWREWFENGYFGSLENCKGIERVGDDYIGAMRCGDGGFEYWIGMLLAPGDATPQGFEAVDISGGPLGVCYVRGRADSAELFGCDVHDACVAAWEAQGWRVPDGTWFFERYNCPRYTVPDETGSVILDFCALLG